jgi:regulator of nonsense transcripts 2
LACCPAQHQEDFSAGPFEDEEARAFYASLPDVRALVPALLLGDAAVAAPAADSAARAPSTAPSTQDSAAADAEEAPGGAAEPANAMDVDGPEADAASAARGA